MALRTKKRPRGRLSMTSLIDVIFLLLLFFMLSSTFTKYGEIELLGSAAGSDGEAPELLFLSLGTERLMLNGQILNADELANHLGKDNSEETRVVLINLDDDVSSQQLMDVLAILRAIAGVKTTVLG
jgi:biopolymer transport protein ExbD